MLYCITNVCFSSIKLYKKNIEENRKKNVGGCHNDVMACEYI